MYVVHPQPRATSTKPLSIFIPKIIMFYNRNNLCCQASHKRTLQGKAKTPDSMRPTGERYTHNELGKTIVPYVDVITC